MDTLETIRKRRAIKHFDLHHQMTDDEIQKIFEHVLLSPTSFNIQHWRFVHVQDRELRKKIRAAAWDQAQVTDASMLVVLCANKNAWQQSQRYWQHAPGDVRDFLVDAINKYYDGREQQQHDEAMRSCGIAAQTLMLTAKAMGYDSCPMVGFDFEAVAKLINLPDDHVICMMVAVGKGLKEAWPRAGQLSQDEVVIKDRF